MITHHGTTKARAYSIKKKGPNIKKFDVDKLYSLNKKPQKAPGDLGSGFYVFMCKDSLKNAKSFSHRRFSNNQKEGRACVCEIKLKNNHEKILDLRIQDNIEYIKEVRNSIPDDKKRQIREAAREDKGKRKVTLDGYLIEIVIDKLYKEESIEVEGVIAETYMSTYMPKIEDQHFRQSIFSNTTELCIRSKTLIDSVKII